MHGVAALLAAAAVAHLLARLLRVPVIPLLLVAGLVLSFIAAPPAQILEDALVLGVSFLLFVVGLELDPRRVRAQRRAALRVGTFQFITMAALGFGAALLLGFDRVESGYIALGLTASSTLVGVRLLQRRGHMFEPSGRLVLGVLLLQDVLVLLAIPIVADLGSGWREVLLGLASIAALGGFSLLVRRWAPALLLRVADDEEVVLLVALAILFLFLGASGALGLPLVVGAFLAGATLARFPVNGVVRSELAPIGDFFTAVFFTALGALVRIPTPVELGQTLALTLLVVLVTPPLVMLIAERAGFAAKPAIEAGLLLSQTSEISLVIGLAGMIQGHIDGGVFVVIALVTLITMLLTPFIATDRVAWRLMHWHPARRGRPDAEAPPSDHLLLLGAGATGMPLLEDLLVAGCRLAVVDDDPGVIEVLSEAEILTIRGEASDPQVLRQAGADRARAVSSTIRRPRDNATLLEMTRGIPVLVRVFDRADAEWVRTRGGIPILYSEATAESLLEWFAENDGALERDAAERAGELPAAAARPPADWA